MCYYDNLCADVSNLQNSGKVALSVRLRKSGSFMVKQYGSHEGMNPETGEKVQVKAK